MMKSLIRVATTVSVFAMSTLATKTTMAQDPVKVDPKHYKVEFENEQIRVLRITYGRYEKSPMHEHPDGQIIYLTDIHVKTIFPNGKSLEERGKAGQTLPYDLAHCRKARFRRTPGEQSYSCHPNGEPSRACRFDRGSQLRPTAAKLALIFLLQHQKYANGA